MRSGGGGGGGGFVRVSAIGYRQSANRSGYVGDRRAERCGVLDDQHARANHLLHGDIKIVRVMLGVRSRGVGLTHGHYT